MTSKSLSVVIVCYNKWAFTKSCLKDLLKLPVDTHQIIIIDNASSDETNTEINKLCQTLSPCNITYIRNEENTFHSKACNQGFRIARGKHVLFLNNDIKVRSNHADWTSKLIEQCDDGSIVGPTMGQLDGNLNFIKEENKRLSGNCYLSGWCIAASKDTWNKLDVTNEGKVWNEEFPFYFNDTDLSFRSRKLNIPLKVIELPVVHFGKVSAAQINIHKLYTEGRKVFISKWK